MGQSRDEHEPPKTEESNNRLEHDRARGDDAFRSGMHAKRAGELELALEKVEEALQAYAASSISNRQVMALVNLAAVEQQLGRHDDALNNLRRALGLATIAGDPGQIALCEGNLGAVYLERGSDEAEPLLVSALEHYRELGAPTGVGNQLGNLAILHQRRGDYDSALACLEEAAVAFVAAQNPLGAAATLRVTGDLYRVRGDMATAASAFERALFLSRELEDVQGEAYARRALGQIRLAAGEVDLATGHCRSALSLHEQGGDVRGLSAAHLDLGQALLVRGELEEGERHLGQAVEIARAGQVHNEVLASALLALGAHRVQCGALAEGMQALEEGHAIYQRLADPYGLTAARLSLVNVAIVAGDWGDAATLLESCAADVDVGDLTPMRPAIAAMRGQMAMLTGTLPEAAAHFQYAARGFEAAGRGRLARTAQVHLTVVLARSGGATLSELPEQLEQFRQFAHHHHSPGAQAEAEGALAVVAWMEHRMDDAFKRMAAAIALVRDLGQPGALSGLMTERASMRLRSAAWRASDPELEAVVAHELEHAARLAEEHGLRPRAMLVRVWQAECARRRGAREEAMAHLEAARASADALDYETCSSLADMVEARMAITDRDLPAARALVARARHAFEKAGAQHLLQDLARDFGDEGAA